MSKSDILKKYNVNDDGTLTPVTISYMSDLSDNKVYLVVDENMRKIFIWKGEGAPVRAEGTQDRHCPPLQDRKNPEQDRI